MIRHNPVGGPLTGVNTLGDGGVTNYAQFAADGELTLHGTARVIEHTDFDNAALGKGATAPVQVILGSFNGWEYDVGDDSHVDYVMKHAHANGTDVTVKIRWYCGEDEATNSGEVQWRCEWAALPADGSELIDGPTHSGVNDTADISIPTTAKQLTETTILVIPGASLSAGDSIGFDISRVALDGGNNPTAKPTVINVHVECVEDKLGEAT